MESKAFFDALQLNKHCTARLLMEERILDRQQRMMYNRVWRQKEILMDDYIHINVRTPSPQKSTVPSSSLSPSIPQLPRAKSSSAAELLKRNAGGFKPPERKKSSLVTTSPRQSSAKLPHTQASDVTAVSGLQNETHLQRESSQQRDSNLEDALITRETPLSVKGRSDMLLPSGTDQIHSEHRVQDVVSSGRTSSADAASDNWVDTSSVGTRQALARVPQGQNPSKTKHKNTKLNGSRPGTVCKKTPASSKDEIDSTCEESAHKRWSTEVDINTSELPGNKEPQKSDARKPVPLERPLSACDIHISTELKRSAIPHTSRSFRRLSLGDAHSSSKQKPVLYQIQMDLMSHNITENDHIINGAGTRTKSSHTNSDQTKHQFVTEPQKDTRGTDQTMKNESKESNSDQGNKSDPNIAKRPSNPPRKKAYTRQMTLDPKLILPLSAKRYQCQKQATIIPVIAVQGRVATLYPNAEAKAGRVVTLDRRVRGWIARSTSILFSLEKIHIKEPLLPFSLSNTPLPQSSPHDERQIPSEDASSPAKTSSGNTETTTQDSHEPNLPTRTSSHDKQTQFKQSEPTEPSKQSSPKDLRRLRSYTSNADDNDSSSDVVLVPQTIHKDPEFPVLKEKPPKEKKKDPRMETMQRQQSLRMKPSRTPLTSLGKLQRV